MKILVTGANGYIGGAVVKQLLQEGHDIVGTDICVERIDQRANRISCNLFEAENPAELFGYPDVVLHLAWRDGFSHYSDAHINDLPRHYSFLEKMAQAETTKKIAVMGSMHEIGFFEGSINENTPCNPTTPYGISKNALRMLTSMLCSKHGKKFQWLRGYYIVGNSEYGNSIFSKITAAEKEGSEFFPFTMGQNQYDFLDFDLFCRYTAACVTQDVVDGIINICSGKPEKLADRVERFIKENNYKIKLQYGAFPDRPYDSKAIWGSAEKIERIIHS